MDVRQRGRVRFGPFCLDLGTGELRKFGIKVTLQSQPFEVLRMLLERAGELVTREELKERVWGSETYIDFDQGLNRAIKKIRAALNDSTEASTFIETLAKRGYRFTAPVTFDSETPITPLPIEVDPPPSRSVSKSWMKFALGSAAVLAVAGFLALRLTRREPGDTPHGNLRQLTRNAAENSLVNAVISPDGNYLLYGDLAGIHLRLISTQETQTFNRPSEISSQDGWFPVSWFPDQSKFVAVSTAATPEGFKYRSWIVSVLGGAIAPLRADALAQSVSPDGSLINFIAGGPFLDQEIWVTGPRGEDARKLATLDGQGAFDNLQWAPDGRHFAALGHRSSSRGSLEFFIESRDLKGSPPVTVLSLAQPFQSFCGFRMTKLLTWALRAARSCGKSR